MKPPLFSLVALLAAVLSVDAAAQSPLPDVPDVARTLGNATMDGAAPLAFCTMADPGPLTTARAQATGPRPVLIGWTIGEQPAGIDRVVAISSLRVAGCTPVQRLPAGGVERIEMRVPYAVVDRAVDWSRGFTALVMASRHDTLTPDEYARRLRRHVRLVTTLFESKGMDGYLVYAGEDFEWAYLHWIDEDTAKRAFATADGATGPKDSLSIQRPLPRTPILP